VKLTSSNDATGAFELFAQAWQRVRGAPPTGATVQSIAAVSQHESWFSHGRPFNPDDFINLGAIQCGKLPTKEGECPPGCKAAPDSKPNRDGSQTKYGACFKASDSFEDAADLVVKNLTTNGREACIPFLVSGDAWGLADAMYRTRYYQGFGATDYERKVGYAKAIYAAAEKNAKNAKVDNAVTLQIPPDPAQNVPPTPENGSDEGGGALLGVAALVTAILAWLNHRRR